MYILFILCLIGWSCNPVTISTAPTHSQDTVTTVNFIKVASACEGSKDHLHCSAWLQLYHQMSQDVMLIEVGHPITYTKTQYWMTQALQALKQNEHQPKMMAYHLLYACLEKIEFRMSDELEKIFNQIEQLLDYENDPLWSIRYLKLLGRFLPVGQADLIKSYTQAHQHIDVRSAAWQVLTQRHKLENTLNSKENILC